MRVYPYDREKAVAYAREWAHGRNPAYYDFSELGGDCTNFASQVLYAGTGVMNYAPGTGWFYINANNRAPSWTAVQYFYNFLANNNGVGPFVRVVPLALVEPGDFVQLSDGAHFYHTPVVVYAGSPPTKDNVLVATHTYDSFGRKLSSYSFQEMRVLHVEGYRK